MPARNEIPIVNGVMFDSIRTQSSLLIPFALLLAVPAPDRFRRFGYHSFKHSSKRGILCFGCAHRNEAHLPAPVDQKRHGNRKHSIVHFVDCRISHRDTVRKSILFFESSQVSQLFSAGIVCVLQRGRNSLSARVSPDPCPCNFRATVAILEKFAGRVHTRAPRSLTGPPDRAGLTISPASDRSIAPPQSQGAGSLRASPESKPTRVSIDLSRPKSRMFANRKRFPEGRDAAVLRSSSTAAIADVFLIQEDVGFGA